MRLIIQIPCFNEEDTIAQTVASLPKTIPGCSDVKVLIIDDGSKDKTVERAFKAGADFVVQHRENRGLAAAFMSGLNAARTLEADIVVNTDADGQYDSNCIPHLVRPILAGDCLMTIGQRPIKSIEEFSTFKKFLQITGSKFISLLSGSGVKDAPSGFRAFHSSILPELYCHTGFSYTIETIFQAAHCGIHIKNVPIEVFETTRPSRLFNGNFQYLKRTAATILRVVLIYRSLQVFGLIAAFLIFLTLIMGVRYIYFMIIGEGDGHVQSLILAMMFFTLGLSSAITGLLGEIIAANRRLLEDIRKSSGNKRNPVISKKDWYEQKK